ncbi:MAG: Cna B-type domain-containing protein [[Eubacterium] sulci]|nr:Cna B-type domain-containing protein [[Eubacterium] sulci]
MIKKRLGSILLVIIMLSCLNLTWAWATDSTENQSEQVAQEVNKDNADNIQEESKSQGSKVYLDIASNHSEELDKTVLASHESAQARARTRRAVSTSVATSYGISDTYVNGRVYWDDANNQDGIRPSEVTVRLYRNGVDTGKTSKGSNANGWEYVFNNLEAYDDNGVGYIYTVKAEPAQGYDAITVDNTEVKFKHIPETISLRIEETWADENEESHIRPEEVDFHLYSSTDVDREYHRGYFTIKASDSWIHVIDGLPKYLNGKLLKYRVNRHPLNNYNFEYVEDDDYKFKIISHYFAYAAEGNISIKKIVDGNPLSNSNFSFRLEAENDDTPMPYGPDGTEERIATVEINGNGEADFGEFWLYDRGIYKYYVTEINGGESNYKYDPTRYTVIFDVHDNNGQLVAFRKIVREDGTEADSLTFTNVYRIPEIAVSQSAPASQTSISAQSSIQTREHINTKSNSIPNTFDDSNAMRYIVLLAASMLLIVFIEYRKRSGLSDTK